MAKKTPIPSLENIPGYSNGVINLPNGIYVPGAEALISFEPSKDSFTDANAPLTVGSYTFVPWGDKNDLPNVVVSKSGNCEIVASNLLFNTQVGYGLGLKPMLKQPDGTLKECDNEEVLEWLENNDINAWFLEQMVDITTFYQPFSEIILDKAGNTIVELRSKEAMYSRWGVMDPKTGKILKHYYSTKWADGAKFEDIAESDVLDRFNPYADLVLRAPKIKRFIVPCNIPTPGRPYYPMPAWWSIFNSGWYDFLVMIPGYKTMLMKNKLTLKYVIYISDKYWLELFNSKGIDKTDVQKMEAAKQEETKRITDFLKNTSSTGGGIIALRKMIQSGNSAIEEKYIEIIELKNDLKGGEYVEDSQEGTSIVCYAQGVHPSLIGAVPGKSSGSMSGTDKRELIMIKQSLMTIFRQRPLRTLKLIQKFNNWPKELVWVLQDFNFTTLDKNKTGKEKTQTEIPTE